ncbi:proteasome-interacting protein cic1 [Elasticomyces elasticus]|uniref:Proteasome-interacting protein cic1 n=1 Tax=Exophiala sideris TaxID=1016849 RepID=A0ABR0J4P0_9EURO|nr:proteasome-interacting protein cic1 [Elasticomyces elasticus]KAK5024995.1 proteasome-interacting protein cic1 [Exophiala sideris]KAK5031415.1 proteasome-interacting protein cic1 [Exophiala sideris]KAK5055033.1 proteasome-interacting protein cic1 [Exophiala sideris]KAK5179914.1 proteasome-interacting protein cic1 [Eurotiomycetes sp. CCFEE 6388]
MTTAVISHKRPEGTPYQLDPDKTLKASQGLLQHVQAETKRLQEESSKRNLLAAKTSDSEDEADSNGDKPIWLTLTTKQHIVDQKRLKPSKISVPHSLNKSSDLRICLIVADPQRAVKNVVADPAFPEHLKSRINRIIGFTKLKARYKTFESRRQLLSEHDIFLADERIVTRLPGVLGKVFYKATTKRPIPTVVAHTEKDKKDQRPKSAKKEGAAPPSSPTVLGKEIEKALDAVPVHLRPGVLVAVRVGLASFKPEQLSENISAVVQKLIEKHVVKGWRNVRGIHIKGQSSVAVPIWSADELWTESEDITTLEDAQEEDDGEQGQKRKRNPSTTKGPQAGARKKTKVENGSDKKSAADRELAQVRKSKLAAQKAQIFGEEI